MIGSIFENEHLNYKNTSNLPPQKIAPHHIIAPGWLPLQTVALKDNCLRGKLPPGQWPPMIIATKENCLPHHKIPNPPPPPPLPLKQISLKEHYERIEDMHSLSEPIIMHYLRMIYYIYRKYNSILFSEKEGLKKSWVRFINRKDWELTSSSYICLNMKYETCCNYIRPEKSYQ